MLRFLNGRILCSSRGVHLKVQDTALCFHFRSKQLRLLLEHILRQFSKDKENRGVSAFVDVNAME